jgi:RNA polymerase sigma-70 factor (ECF subfamily)
MDNFTTTTLETLVTQAYATAFTAHGDLGLKCREYSTHLYSIIERRAGVSAPALTACEFIARLHLSDLYLALACAQGSEAAWGHFAALYNPCIRQACKHLCPSNAARDFADALPGELFLPDATGRSRIASYEGVSPLTVWLATVIRHWAGSERRRKVNHLERIDQISDLADETSIFKTEARLRADRYRDVIKDSMESAIDLLSDRERLILCLRYERQLQVSDIARQFGVKPHAITQQIDRSGQKLRRRIIYLLTIRHRLGPAVVEECVADLLNNPEHALPALSLAGP